MLVSEGCLRDNKRFAVICLENSKDVVDEFSDYIHDTLPDSLYISGNGFRFPEHRWTSHITCLMACHPFFQEIVVEKKLTENLMLGSHSPFCISLLVPVPPPGSICSCCFQTLRFATWERRHPQWITMPKRELCAYERQLLLLWDSCSIFKALFAPNEERVKAIKKFFFLKINSWRFMAVFWRAPVIKREKEENL